MSEKNAKSLGKQLFNVDKVTKVSKVNNYQNLV